MRSGVWTQMVHVDGKDFFLYVMIYQYSWVAVIKIHRINTWHDMELIHNNNTNNIEAEQAMKDPKQYIRMAML